MPADVNVFDKIRTFSDYQKADEEFQLKKQLQNAQIQELNRKSVELDADKIGQQAFLKAAQGLPLSAQEGAALKYIDAKSPTSAFNPVTGVLEQKPSLLQRAGLLNGGAVPSGNETNVPAGGNSNVALQNNPSSDYDLAYQQQLNSARGNPKLQQAIRENYSKAKFTMNEEQAKSAAYADRMVNSSPIIDNTAKASMDAGQVARDSVPLVGNYLTSDSYQSAKQAQLDFINAILRRESGAAISPSEYKSYAKQYFPQPGDSDEVLSQKSVNRQKALNGVERSAGPAYTATLPPKSTPDGLPQGATIYGTSGGKNVYKLPNGSFIMEQ